MSYSKTDRAWSDVRNTCDATKIHVLQAADYVPFAYELDDVKISVSEERHDMDSAVDSIAYVEQSNTRYNLLSGCIQFRFQRRRFHSFLNVSISKEYANGRPAEFYKSCANVGIFGTAVDDDNPNKGYTYFVVYDFALVIRRLKFRSTIKRERSLESLFDYHRRLNQVIRRQLKHNPAKNEDFFTIEINELARIGALRYIGVDISGRHQEDGSDSPAFNQLLGSLHNYPEIVEHLVEQNFWKSSY